MNLDVSGPGGTAAKQVLLTVAANSPPVAIPGGPYTATVGKPVMVDASGSTDPDGDPLSYSWALSRGGSVIGRYNGSTLSMTLNKSGSYSVLLTVRDDRGGVSSASTEINSYITPLPLPQTTAPQRSVAAALPAPAPNARVSAASIPQAAEPAAVPSLWGSGGGVPVSGGSAGYYPAGLQQQAAGQQQLMQPQQQLLQQQQAYQQAGRQQLLLAGYQQQQLPYSQQQQQLMQQQQPQQQLYGQALPAAQLYQQQQPYAAPQQQPQAAALQGMQSGASPGLGMCLFKDGKPDYNPWNAAAALKGQLLGSYWAPCPMTTTSGSGGPAGVPLGPALTPTPPTPAAPAAPDPAAAAPAAVATAAAAPAPAPVAAAAATDLAAGSGSSSSNPVSVASTDGADPVQSSASIRLPGAFVKADGPATKVCVCVCVQHA